MCQAIGIIRFLEGAQIGMITCHAIRARDLIAAFHLPASTGIAGLEVAYLALLTQ